MITAVVGRDIHLKGNINDFQYVSLIEKLEAELRWPNPEYAKKERMGKWLGKTPRFINLMQEVGGHEYIVPFGMLQALFDEKKAGVDIYFAPDDHISAQKPVRAPVRIEGMGLYGYQENAVKAALKVKNGVVVAPCGSGKTQMGLAICGALGLRCLWLTHTHDLLKQSMNRAMSFLSIDRKEIGTITEGKVNVGSYITFATVQTMAMIDLEPFREYWDVVIVDECHKAVGTPTRMTMFWKVISGLSARYKIGLTATPKRGDGMQKAMFALLGAGYVIQPEEVKATTCPLKAEVVYTGWEPSGEVFNPDGTLNYVQLITACTEDSFRNDFIMSVIEQAEGPVMVLSERVHHLELLAKNCSRPHAIMSTAKKKERDGILDNMKSGKIQVLFATFQLAKEGLDIPCLRHLVMASPIKDEIAVVQSVGRVMRKSEGKEYGTVWDFKDEMRMLQGWHRKRMKLYGRLQNDQ